MGGVKWNNKLGAKEPELLDDKNANYSLLRESSDGSENLDDKSQTLHILNTKNKIRHYLSLLTKGLLIIFAFWGLVNVGKSAVLSLTHKPVSCSCGGTTVAEAKSRGCVFTQLSLGWLPPQCLDLELADEFDKQGPLPGGMWPYWADLNATTRITIEEIALLADAGGHFYTTQEWHIVHCMYTWKKHYRSKFNGVTIEATSDGIPHISHCLGIMLDRMPLQDVGVLARAELNADRGKAKLNMRIT